MKFNPARLDRAQRIHQRADRISDFGLAGSLMGLAFMLAGSKSDGVWATGLTVMVLSLIPCVYGLWLLRKAMRILEGKE